MQKDNTQSSAMGSPSPNECTGFIGISMDAHTARDLASRVASLNLSCPETQNDLYKMQFERLEESELKFDLSGFATMHSDDEYDEELRNIDEVDLNKAFTTKTMSHKEMALMASALGESGSMMFMD